MPTGDRDRVVDQLLRSSAGSLLAGAGRDCVDAEVLAAWSEGGLDAATSTRIEQHLATCAACQAMAAAFARLDVAAPAPAPARTGWHLRWLVPVAVASAAAIGIWVLVPRQAVTPSTDNKVALNEAPAVSAAPPVAAPPAPVPEPSPVAANGAEGTPPADARERAAMKSEVAAAPALRDDAAGAARGSAAGAVPPAPAATNAAPPPPPASSQSTARSEAVQVTAGAPLIQAQSGERSVAVSSTQVENLPIARGNFTALAAGVPAAAQPDTASRETRLGGAGQNNIQMDAISPGDAGPSAPVIAEFAAPASAVAAEPGLQGAAGRAGAVPVASRGVVTPATRWRVLSDGRVQRSVTNGTSWDVVAVDASLHVMAGGAPSSMVCWLVGPGGVVLRTTDRLHFERLTFPEAVDLIGVRATSDLAAAVTTHDGRTFATTDAGRTWRAEP